jgi:hypothetical protein
MSRVGIIFILGGALALAQTYQIRGVPDRGRPFTMKMDDADSIGSIYKCMDRIRKPHWWSRGKGTGRCVIEPHSIRAGRHAVLARKYPGVLVDVREP